MQINVGCTVSVQIGNCLVLNANFHFNWFTLQKKLSSNERIYEIFGGKLSTIGIMDLEF